MLEAGLVDEATRQFSLCNACRYCEGVCSVFPAMEMRTAFNSGDISYLATLCHDCRACLHVCPFSDPHEFAIDIPALMATARLQTYSDYARPQALWKLLTRPRAVLIVVLASFAFYLVLALLSGGNLFAVHHGTRSFYHVVAYLWLVIPTGVLSLIAVGAILAGVRAFARDSSVAAREMLRPTAHRRAVTDALALRNLRGGGGGCMYPGDEASAKRRRLHHLVFYGFGLMFLATVAAALEQDILRVQPPYPVLSVPVLAGTIGGIATVAGCIGFLWLGVVSREPRKSTDTRRIDRIFTATLFAGTLTGLLTLVLRSTSLLGPMLIIHLAVLGGLFVTLPYSKFVHWVYRYTALVRSHAEARVKTPPQTRETAVPDLVELLVSAEKFEA
jgi:citrate/tricarballylate utilization protein